MHMLQIIRQCANNFIRTKHKENKVLEIIINDSVQVIYCGNKIMENEKHIFLSHISSV